MDTCLTPDSSETEEEDVHGVDHGTQTQQTVSWREERVTRTLVRFHLQKESRRTVEEGEE